MEKQYFLDYAGSDEEERSFMQVQNIHKLDLIWQSS